MNSITFDTLKYANRLEKAGLTREQAETFAEAQKDLLSEALDTTLATRADVSGLKVDIARLENRIEAVELRMTVKFGVMLVAAVGVIVAILRIA